MPSIAFYPKDKDFEAMIFTQISIICTNQESDNM